VHPANGAIPALPRSGNWKRPPPSHWPSPAGKRRTVGPRRARAVPSTSPKTCPGRKACPPSAWPGASAGRWPDARARREAARASPCTSPWWFRFARGGEGRSGTARGPRAAPALRSSSTTH